MYDVNKRQTLRKQFDIEDKVAIVDGVKRLSGAKVKAMDLRGAASLVVAGLSAEGTTVVTNIKHLQRGYENIEENLKNIGASVIKRNEWKK